MQCVPWQIRLICLQQDHRSHLTVPSTLPATPQYPALTLFILCHSAASAHHLPPLLPCCQAGGDASLSRKERMMRQLGLASKTEQELAEEVAQLQDDWDDDD